MMGVGVSSSRAPSPSTRLPQRAGLWTQVLAHDRLPHPPLLGHVWLHLETDHPTPRTKFPRLGQVKGLSFKHNCFTGYPAVYKYQTPSEGGGEEHSLRAEITQRGKKKQRKGRKISSDWE